MSTAKPKTAAPAAAEQAKIDPRLQAARQTPSIIAQAQVRNGMTQDEIDARLWEVIGGKPAA